MRSPLHRAAAAAAIVLSLLGKSCQTPGPAATDSAAAITPAEVEAVMAVQQAAWNRGDLEAFVACYDPGMTFLGAGGVTRGTANLLANYRRGYPTAAARGQLAFDLLEFRPLGSDTILVLGQYRIARAAPASGFFTLLLARTPAGLRIVHDHTSVTPPVEPGR